MLSQKSYAAKNDIVHERRGLAYTGHEIFIFKERPKVCTSVKFSSLIDRKTKEATSVREKRLYYKLAKCLHNYSETIVSLGSLKSFEIIFV